MQAGSSSTLICVQTPVLPLMAHESFSGVVAGSPGRGIVSNLHSSFPSARRRRAQGP
jgi:hypothetical protein